MMATVTSVASFLTAASTSSWRPHADEPLRKGAGTTPAGTKEPCPRMREETRAIAGCGRVQIRSRDAIVVLRVSQHVSDGVHQFGRSAEHSWMIVVREDGPFAIHQPVQCLCDADREALLPPRE